MLQQQQNPPAQASYETMSMQQQNIPAQGYAQAASSPGRFSSHGGGASRRGGGPMSPYEREMNARLQQHLVHTGSSGYDDQQCFPQRYDDQQQQQHQQYFDRNMDSMGRGRST
jgi:hypothetical protein